MAMTPSARAMVARTILEKYMADVVVVDLSSCGRMKCLFIDGWVYFAVVIDMVEMWAFSLTL